MGQSDWWQINLRDAVKGTISYTNEQGKCYQLKASPAVLIARVEDSTFLKNMCMLQGKPIAGDYLILLCILP